MLDSQLRGIDLAALDTLRTVYRRRSFTAAAEDLNVKQSSVSYTIDRLRKSFQDPLFVRQGNVVEPTERCAEIVETADRIIGAIELAALPADFDPVSTKASVTIALTYLSRLVLMPQVIRELRHEAPGIAVEFVTGFTEAKVLLMSNQADMALSPVVVEESGLYGRFLFEDPYICLMDRTNPLASQPLTAERFAAAPHLVVNFGQKWQPPFHHALRARGLDMQVALSTPNPEDVRHLIAGTDLVVTMPSKIARHFADGLFMCACPVPVSATLNLYWPARLNTSPLHGWLRDKILRVAGEVRESGALPHRFG